ncbi:phosphoribosylamine--glycine ligase [Prochlorococcus marinus]|uniref:phosphoribosylamine--glycine ligase n=1 Tax=Prochlorococcus marinus TaxID=1219 RepID=UPI0022B37BCF|nr:phosphoribosylamine--glycine ligase [Prochlorococcus marinus]
MNSEKTPRQLFFPQSAKILVIGSGGRENSLAWTMAKSEKINQVFVAPGNGGTEEINSCKRLNIEESNGQELISACKSLKIDLIVIGGEKPLAAGLADELRAAGLIVFGPCAKGAQLEASKNWAKQLMTEANIPTAQFWTANNKNDAIKILKKVGEPLVVKADGLAAGKGVRVCSSLKETETAIHEIFKGKFGKAGEKVVLEECLEGPEISIFALCDGESLITLPPAQDHKRLLDGDKGPNTGGMGAYAPAKIVSQEELNEIKETILVPTLEALIRRGINYRGVIYAGLMLTKEGPKVIEYNCRFGDPECQALMPLMGPELAEVLYSAALGTLKKAPKLSFSKLMSACVVATTSGYPEDPKIGDKISIDFDKSDKNRIQIFHAGSKKNDLEELVTSGGRVLSIVGQAENYEDAFKNVYNELKNVHFEGINYRLDIGNQVRSDFQPINNTPQ